MFLGAWRLILGRGRRGNHAPRNPPRAMGACCDFGVRRLGAAFPRRDSSRRSLAANRLGVSATADESALEKAGTSSRTPKTRTAPSISVLGNEPWDRLPVTSRAATLFSVFAGFFPRGRRSLPASGVGAPAAMNHSLVPRPRPQGQ